MKIILKKTIILTVLVSFNFFSFGQALKVKSNGDVGIGIDPAEKFHINGSIRGNLTAGALKVQTTQGYMTIGPYNSSFAHFFTDLSCFYFSNTIKVNGHFASYYNNNLYLSTDAST